MIAPERRDPSELALAAHVQRHVQRGWGVESQNPAQAVLVKHRQNYSRRFHFWVGLATGTLWWFYWPLYLAFRRRRVVLTADGHGDVTVVYARRGASRMAD